MTDVMPNRSDPGLSARKHAFSRSISRTNPHCHTHFSAFLVYCPRKSRGQFEGRRHAMKIEGEGQLLRVFIDENDQWEGKPLFQE
ncbi:MAG: hypothetical protein ACK5Q4_01450, partial [Phycisphaerae bacterium]